MWVCIDLDGIDCLDWAPYTGLFPPLAIGDAVAVGGAIIGLWVLGWAVGYIARVINPR